MLSLIKQQSLRKLPENKKRKAERIGRSWSYFISLIKKSWPIVFVIWLYHSISNLQRRFYCFLTGQIYHDEEAENKRKQILANEFYRDRLMTEEISVLLDLQTALRLSHTERHQYYLNFLKIDWTRRSSVSPRQLLLFCGIRRTRFTESFFALKRVKGIRKSSRRLDIIQLFMMLFSICTVSPYHLVEDTLLHMQTDVVVIKKEAAHEKAHLHEADRASFQYSSDSITSTELMKQVFSLMEFIYGALNENEKCLMKLLREFYTPFVTSSSGINFMKVHKIRQFRDLLYLFPVLIYPAFHVQHTLRVRVVGNSFWSHLAERRALLSNTTSLFVSHSELLSAIATADDLEGSSKKRRNIFKSFWKAWKKRRGGAAARVVSEDADSVLGSYASAKEAWKVTSDNLLATIHVRNSIMSQADKNSGSSSIDASEEFQRISRAMRNKSISSEEVRSVYKSIVKSYGYGFAKFVFGLSHLAHTILDPHELEIVNRFESALRDGTSIPVDDSQVVAYFDPKHQAEFYYDFRTGESTWEKPVAASI